MTHDLKTWPEYFQLIWDGKKKFEVRKNDREFNSWDYLNLMEYDPRESTEDKEVYTGRSIYCKITYILIGGTFGVEPGYCVMSIEVINKTP